MDDAPGSVMPIASASAVMVAAVPMVMQMPEERAMPSSISLHVFVDNVPARRSAQYFHASDAGAERFAVPIAAQHRSGRDNRWPATPALVAPSRRPGVVLSQPPISTAPSTGCERINSSVSIASILR